MSIKCKAFSWEEISSWNTQNVVWHYLLSSYMFELKFNFTSSKYSGHKHLSERIMIWGSHLNVFFKGSCPRKLSKFTGKHLCRILPFNKVAGCWPATLLKRTPAQVFYHIHQSVNSYYSIIRMKLKTTLGNTTGNYHQQM